jgi:hypothetical protein
VVYFKVVQPADAIIRVEDYRFAVSQMAQTSLRSIIGKSELDDLLSNREKLNQGLELMIDSPAVEWGVTVDRVEIKDVSLPETMKRSMARQAEAQRDRRARVINADAELEASKKLAQAAEQMSGTPAALQLRLLQTVASVATEKNSTLVLPFPVELLRFLEGAREEAASNAKGDGKGNGNKRKGKRKESGSKEAASKEVSEAVAEAELPSDPTLPPEAVVPDIPEGPAPGAIAPPDEDDTAPDSATDEEAEESHQKDASPDGGSLPKRHPKR